MYMASFKDFSELWLALFNLHRKLAGGADCREMNVLLNIAGGCVKM
jgi:hypothetical protein